jgi:hypothetical protein
METSILFKTMSAAGEGAPACPTCEVRMERTLSRVSIGANGSSEGSEAGARQGGSNSPAQLSKIMREASKGGERDLGSGFKEVAARLGKGEGATSVERSLRKRVGEQMSAH